MEKLTADLVTIGVTPQVVGKVMRRWIRNFLIDRARRTPLGRIRRKIEEDMLGQYPEFLRVPAGKRAPVAGISQSSRRTPTAATPRR